MRIERLRLPAGLALLATMLSGYAGHVALPERDGESAAVAAPALPTRFDVAPPWTAALARAPIGRAVGVYVDRRLDRLTIIGARDEVRVYDRPEWSLSPDDAPTLLLRPDGRLLAMPHLPEETVQRTRLLDLADGSVRILDAGAPLAWSADGRLLLVVRFDGDPTSGEKHGGELRVVDMDTAKVAWTVALPPRPDAFLRLTAVFSPDGSAFAVQHGDDLAVHRRDGGSWRITVDSRSIAGPGAWPPPGGTVVLMDRTGRLERRDAATGRPAGTAPVAGWPGARLIGWREGMPVVVDGRTVRMLGDHPAVLLTAPKGTMELELATDALAGPTREPGSPRPGPFWARFAAPIEFAALALAAGLALIGWRRSRSRWAGSGPWAARRRTVRPLSSP